MNKMNKPPSPTEDSGRRGAAKRIGAPAGPEMFFNREWSWLDFDNRVFALAADTTVPLLERVKFLSIVSTNLDEFFMVRVAGLKEQVRTGMRETGPDGVSARDQLEGISRRVRELTVQQERLWLKEIRPMLGEHGIAVVNRDDLTRAEDRYIEAYFTKQVLPVLTPMGVDPAHPFPHLPNRSLCLCVVLKNRPDCPGPKQVYAFVEVPQVLPRFVPLSKRASRFILLDEIIAMHLPKLFAGMRVAASYPIRITRDSDLEIDEEEAEDLLKVMELELRQRQWGNTVRLEISKAAPEPVRAYLRASFELEERDVFPVDGPLNYGDFMFLARLQGHQQLLYPPFAPHVRQGWRQTLSPFEHIRAGDVLVHHPYESFNCVAEFVEKASSDPQVLALKITLYRTSPESSIMKSLMKAANNGKQVVALVELKARFDEANNIQWARLLEREGVHVVYGIVGLKTHCKACLVVRREGKRLRRYAHLATGNYNPTTAGIYTDLGLFTADPSICEDTANLFNKLTGFAATSDWNRLVISPESMHTHLLELIQQEIRSAKRNGKGRIVCKMNSLVEPQVIKALYAASQAGVKIDLIVRGMCALRPGVPGISDNIRVVSIVGRFLEHSRIFCFGSGSRMKIYLSSADWMQRNFFSRLELMFPVEDPDLKTRIMGEILANCLKDNVNAWELRSDGSWKRRSPSSPENAHNCHDFFIRLEERRPRAC